MRICIGTSLLFTTILSLTGCEKIETRAPLQVSTSAKESSPTSQTIQLKAEPPDFGVKVNLSDDAKKWLAEKGETVVVSASFADEIGPDGLSLGYARIELHGPGIANIKNIDFNEKISSIIPDKDYEVLINVFSGRRKDDRNLLDCNPLQGRISSFQKKILPVNCTLTDSAGKPEEINWQFTGEMRGKEFKETCPSKMLEDANNKGEEGSYRFCVGFVRGIVNAHDSFVGSEEYTGKRLFCIPRKTTDAEYAAKAIRSAENMDISDDADMGTLILASLHKSYPCEKDVEQ